MALSRSFEYLCYGSAAIINFNSFSLYTSESDVNIRQIMKFKYDPSSKRVKGIQ